MRIEVLPIFYRGLSVICDMLDRWSWGVAVEWLEAVGMGKSKWYCRLLVCEGVRGMRTSSGTELVRILKRDVEVEIKAYWLMVENDMGEDVVL
jgi:hypothetical protein